MRPRFPLYAKIVLWFFLNLALILVAFAVFIGAQARTGFDLLMSGGASARIEALGNVIMTELAERPRTEWNRVLERFGRAYRVRFFLFQRDGLQLAGEPVELPLPVRLRLAEGPDHRWPPSGSGPGRFRRTWDGSGRERDDSAPDGRPAREPGKAPPDPPRPATDAGYTPPDAPRPPAEGPPAAPQAPWQKTSRSAEPPPLIVRAGTPSRYWVIVRRPLPEQGNTRRILARLLAEADSLGSGLFFDFGPWLLAGLVAVVLSAILWFPLVRGITRSLGEATRAAERIAEGRFDTRVDERRRDELGLLGRAINRMAARLEDFITGQRRFLGGIAHELCSPLARLRLAIGILEERASEGERPFVNSAGEKAAQLADLVNELLSFSRASMGAMTMELRPVAVREAAEKAARREAAEGVEIRIDVGEDVVVLADAELLTRALANLLRNGVRYAGHAGPISVSAQGEGREVILRVTDQGPGVPEAELARVFDPFYRVEASRDRATGGVGLGLTIVKTCVESCRGRVTCRNLKPAGLEVAIRLAAAPPPPAP